MEKPSKIKTKENGFMILFLDIDGVMNMYGRSCSTMRLPKEKHIEPNCCERLNYICEVLTELNIVISSAWRRNMDNLQIHLEEAGFKYWDRVIGKTPRCHREHDDYSIPADLVLKWRGEQILDWLTKNEYSGKYLVVDDEVIDICGEKCNSIPKENVLQTDSDEGMLNKDARKIVDHFTSYYNDFDKIPTGELEEQLSVVMDDQVEVKKIVYNGIHYNDTFITFDKLYEKIFRRSGTKVKDKE
jgi:hypothetical protein